ncbi:hypothetical protein [Prosthecobacter fluviatilis]|uniref:Uncharacterized protein n=1 Tax=Prosthecobacter fluviatilis TaxID=445931 RepID=A0ABW0KIY2_9BACT
MTSADQQFSVDGASACFATLAFGRDYRYHAERLALDFAVHASHFPLVMLVDRPQDIMPRPNLRTLLYRPEGALRRYHDKRLLVRAGLDAGYATVVVIDANSRLVEKLPDMLELRKGVNAFITQPVLEHLREEEAAASTRKRFASTAHQRRCLERAAQSLGLSLENVTFIQESIYALHGPEDILRQFVECWGRLGHFMDYHGLAWSEGFAIGLAAAAVGLDVHENRFLPMNCFYKHRLHGAALARGQLEAPRVLQAQEDARLLARFMRRHPLNSRLRSLYSTASMAARWAACRMSGEPRLLS